MSEVEKKNNPKEESTIETVKNALAEPIKQRLKDDILGQYIVTFLLWNHEIFFIALDPKLPMSMRYDQIKDRIWDVLWVPFPYNDMPFPLVNFLVPAIFCWFLLFKWPLVSRTWKMKKRQINLGVKNDIDGVTAESSKKDVQIEFLQERNAKLDKEVLDNHESNKQIQTTLHNANDDLTREHKKEVERIEEKAIRTKFNLIELVNIIVDDFYQNQAPSNSKKKEFLKVFEITINIDHTPRTSELVQKMFESIDKWDGAEDKELLDLKKKLLINYSTYNTINSEAAKISKIITNKKLPFAHFLGDHKQENAAILKKFFPAKKLPEK